MSVGERLQNFEFATAGAASTSNPPTSNGQTAAGAIGTTNSGAVNVVGGSLMSGTLCLECSQTTTTASDAYFRWLGYTTTIGSLAWSWETDSLPSSGTQVIFRSFSGGNSARWVNVSVNPTNHLVLSIYNGTTDVIVWTSTQTVAINTEYRFALAWSSFAVSSTVSVAFNIYSDDFTTLWETGYSGTPSLAATATNVVDLRWGRSGGTITGPKYRYDNVRATDLTSTMYGPVNTAAATGTATISLTGSASIVPAAATGSGTISLTGSGSAITADMAKIGVFGDSLTNQGGNGTTDITAALVAVGWSSGNVYIDGLNSRAIWAPHGATPYTGTAINTMRASSFEPYTWIIALGTNNTGFLVSDTMVDYRSLLAAIGPGHVVHFIGLGYQDQTECQVQYNGAAAVGSRWSEKNTVAGRPNAALLNIIDQGTNPSTEPTIYFHNWNDYGPLRSSATPGWDPTDTSSPNGTSRHMVRAGYQTYRDTYYALASLGPELPASGTATITLTGASGAASPASGTASITLTGAGAAAAAATTTAAVSLTGVGGAATPATGSATVTLTGVAAATAAVSGAAAVSLTGTATATAPVAGTSSVTLVGAGTAATPAAAIANVTLTGAGQAAGRAYGTASFTVAGTVSTAPANPSDEYDLHVVTLGDRWLVTTTRED